jgi:cytochrome c oxidase subunit III
MSDGYRIAPAEQFENLAQQAHAAKLGMAVFVASEAMLFSGLFTLFLAYQAQFPAAFHLGVHHNTKVLGSINTGVLLLSSTLVAIAVHALRGGRRKLTCLLLSATILLGLCFLGIKLTEYFEHFHDGIYPGGVGSFFIEHTDVGVPEFWTLYFVMTGIHALHVTVGIGLLTYMLIMVIRRRVAPPASHPLDIAAIYWHLVDLVWIFLWPLFYLA